MASTEQKEVEENGSMISGLLDKAKGFFAEKLANVPTPEAAVDNVDFKGVTRQGVDYHAKVSVKNPYSQTIPICQISYVLKSATRFPLLTFFSLFFLLQLFMNPLIYMI